MRTLVLNALCGGTTLGCLQSKATVVGVCDPNRHHERNFPNIPVFSSTHDVRKIPHADLTIAMIQPNKISSLSPWVCLGLLPRQIVFFTRMKKWPKWIRGLDNKWNWWFESLAVRDFGVPVKTRLKFAVGFRKDIKVTFSHFPFPEKRGSVTLTKFLDPCPDESLYVKNTNNFKLIKPDGIWPISYGKKYLLNDQQRARKLSFIEMKRIWGFPENFSTGTTENIFKEPHPPIIADVVKEVIDWAWV